MGLYDRGYINDCDLDVLTHQPKRTINGQIKEQALEILEADERVLLSRQDIRGGPVPRCPVCGSSNIKKISSFAKYLNLKTAGLNSATLNKQMECKNCGYMF